MSVKRGVTIISFSKLFLKQFFFILSVFGVRFNWEVGELGNFFISFFFLKNFVALALPVFLTNANLLNKRPFPPFSGKTKTCDPPPSLHFFCIVPHLFYCQILTGISTGSPDFMEFLGLELYENEQTTFLIPQLRL